MNNTMNTVKGIVTLVVATVVAMGLHVVVFAPQIFC